MKKILCVILLLTLLVSITACGGSEKPAVTTAAPTTQAAVQPTTTSPPQTTPSETQPALNNSGLEVDESEIGIRTIHHKNKEVNISVTTGDFELLIEAVQVADMQVAKDYQYLFDEKDRVTVITLQVSVENKSAETLSFYPYQGTLVTNTKEQIDADFWLSDDVGGDFIGNVVKKGNIIFVSSSNAEDINFIKYICGGPYDSDFDKVGEDISVEYSY